MENILIKFMGDKYIVKIIDYANMTHTYPLSINFENLEKRLSNGIKYKIDEAQFLGSLDEYIVTLSNNTKKYTNIRKDIYSTQVRNNAFVSTGIKRSNINIKQKYGDMVN
jgi:hypothetical protein